MGSLIEELKLREAAALAEADRLRSRIKELSEDLARAEEQASRLAIAREEVARVLEEPAVADPPAGQNGKPEGETRSASPIGAVTVPPWQEGLEASVLPQAYQDLLDVAADAGRPLRAGEFAAAAGLPARQGEGGGPAVEAEAAGRAGLAGRGARRPVHAARITQGKQRNPDGNGLFFLSSEVLANPDPKGRRTLMAEYCAVPPDDPFAVSKGMFAALAAELAGPAAAVLTASELEEFLDERGREVLRQLLQDHYDLREAREEQQAREHPGPVTGADGIVRTRLETGHGRLLATLFGTVLVTRCAWRCPGSGELQPGRRGPVPAGRAALPYPGEAGRGRGGPRLLRRPRTTRSPAAAGRLSASGRSSSPSCTPPPTSPPSTPPGSRSRARRERCWSCPPTARAS